MPLPLQYNSQSSAIASYNYTDLAENTGIKLFYLAVANDGTGIITQNQVYSDLILREEDTAVSDSYVKIRDDDYDLSPFNLPKDIRGTALFTYSLYSTAGSYAYTKILVRKWDGTTETEIANASSPARLNPSHIELTKITIPHTHFSVGEQLRITVELYLKAQVAGVDQADYGTDPMNRESTFGDPPVNTTVGSQFKCWIPFDLDL